MGGGPYGFSSYGPRSVSNHPLPKASMQTAARLTLRGCLRFLKKYLVHIATCDTVFCRARASAVKTEFDLEMYLT